MALAQKFFKRIEIESLEAGQTLEPKKSQNEPLASVDHKKTPGS